jgi:hypothetical protein
VDVGRVATFIGIYLAAGIAFLVAVNADQANGDIPSVAIAASAILVGWGTGNLGWRALAIWMTLPCVLVVLGLPFGRTNAFTGGDDLDAVAFIAVFPALASVVLMLVGAGARSLFERYRRNAGPAAASE